MKFIHIPTERVGALIGPEGKVKTRIEQWCSCRINIDSATGGVSIDDSKDPYLGMKASDMVLAIGRGFPPDAAFRLKSDDVYFALFDIREFTGKSSNRVREMRGRMIGTNGKMRGNIEKVTGANISISGNTIAIICDIEGMETAKKAVDMLLSGSEHSAVNKFMERSRSKMAYDRMRDIV